VLLSQARKDVKDILDKQPFGYQELPSLSSILVFEKHFSGRQERPKTLEKEPYGKQLTEYIVVFRYYSIPLLPFRFKSLIGS
jgi:hypothetical protein